jgi:hypothetical protein
MRSAKMLSLKTLSLLLLITYTACTYQECDPFVAGFGIETLDAVPSGTGTGPLPSLRNVVAPNRTVNGLVSSISQVGASGNVQNFTVITGGDGKRYIDDGYTPAVWNFTLLDGPCRFPFHTDGSIRLQTHPNTYTSLVCRAGLGRFGFAPAALDVTDPPPTFTIGIANGEGVSTTYGMPTLVFYDLQGQVVAQTVATSADSTAIIADTPVLSHCYSGAYIVGIQEATADGVGSQVGTAIVGLYGNDPPEPPCIDVDGDGFCQGNDCNDHDFSIYPGASTNCGGGEDRNCNSMSDYLECYGDPGSGCGSGGVCQ